MESIRDPVDGEPLAPLPARRNAGCAVLECRERCATQA
jgi:hypothetical protein